MKMTTIQRPFSPVVGSYLVPKPTEPIDLRNCVVETPFGSFDVKGVRATSYDMWAVKVTAVTRRQE
jgi:hypothetical protein